MRSEHKTTGQNDSWIRLALLGGLLAGFGLRLFRLGAGSLWYDETVSVVLARKPLAEMLAHTARDIHPPGYYALLHSWQAITGPTLAHGLEFLFAWPSLWAGMLILALLYPLGRRLVGARAALMALWLAAVNPFHLWYGQEVRMYTVGAALGMLCLWALLRFMDQTRGSPGWLAVYVIAAAAGLYTLYYFAFLLIAINLIAILLIWRTEKPGFSKKTGFWWLGAQVAVILLWLPWLPIVWKQAMNPPVPGWRAPWRSWSEFISTLSESLGALSIGQTPPGMRMWTFALLTLAAVILFLWPGKRGRGEIAPLARPIILTYIFAPMALLYLLTATVTPLYHVRYLFTYAPPFMLVLAVAVLRLGEIRRWLGVTVALLLLGLSAWGLQQFWFNPAYRADDHRTAVAELARDWRPGDIVLVNAGWAYTALGTYWPTELAGPLASTPPPLTWSGRFTDYVSRLENGESLVNKSGAPYPVIVAQAGSVGGDPSLGWGDPESDFFAVSADETVAALETLASHHPRIWHYRLYDTVSDPDGLIREWLDENAEQFADRPYPGRDFLRVQQYSIDRAVDGLVDRPNEQEGMPTYGNAKFGDALRLDDRDAFTPVEAGDTFYANTYWTALPGIADLPADLSLSLRLYLGDELALQHDEPFQPSTAGWQPGEQHQQSLALPIPVSTKPLRYRVEIVVYRRDTGEALPPSGDEAKTTESQRWLLGVNDVFLPPHPPDLNERLVAFDYIDLVQAMPGAFTATPGDTVTTELIWLPNPSEYSDAYDAVIELRDQNDVVLQSWSRVAGGDNYPSSVWPAGYPVRELRELPLETDLPAGEYTLTLRLERASDGLAIAARSGGFGVRRDAVEIGEMEIR